MLSVCPSRSSNWLFVPLNSHPPGWRVTDSCSENSDLHLVNPDSCPSQATRSLQFHADATERIHSHFCFQGQQINRFGTCFWETVVSAADCDSAAETTVSASPRLDVLFRLVWTCYCTCRRLVVWDLFTRFALFTPPTHTPNRVLAEHIVSGNNYEWTCSWTNKPRCF